MSTGAKQLPPSVPPDAPDAPPDAPLVPKPPLPLAPPPLAPPLLAPLEPNEESGSELPQAAARMARLQVTTAKLARQAEGLMG